MTWRGRRRGVFEGPPRALYRRAGARYLDLYALGIVLNGVVVAGFGVAVTALYVDLSAGELALFAACSAAGYVVENLVAGVYLRRAGAPVRDMARGATAATRRRYGRGRRRRRCPWSSCVVRACT